MSNSTPTTTPLTNTNETIFLNNNSLLSINMSNVSKLTNTNYLMWSLHVNALLDGYALASHLDASATIPSVTTTIGDVTSENSKFIRWKRQDKLIYSALLGAISTLIQPMVSRTTTASQIWDNLAATYAKPSRGHIKQLKDQLKYYTKGNKSIDEYLQGIMTKLDQLAILGKPFEHEDQVELILEGLSDDYKTVVDQSEGKDTPLSITEIHEWLLNHEAKLIAVRGTSSSVVPSSANVVQHRPQNNYNNTGYYNNKRYNNNSQNNDVNFHQSQSVHRSAPRPFKSYLGKCQMCNTQGHSAKRCPQFQSLQSPMTQPQANPFHPWLPRANLAMSSPYNATNWLIDSGATHHITSDLHHLSLHQPYHGTDDVLIADGSTLPISHMGSSILPTSTCGLALQNILCVPNVDKNLISVYRLCNTNVVSVEFFPALFQVKNLSTGSHYSKTRLKTSFMNGMSWFLKQRVWLRLQVLKLLSFYGTLGSATSLYLF